MSKSQKSDENCQTCNRRDSGIFCVASPHTLTGITEQKTHHSYRSGEYIFHQGDRAQGIFCVRTGAIKLESESECGNNHLLHIIEPGGVMGYRSILDGETYHCSAIALKDTEICFIPQSVFMRTLETDPLVALEVIRKLSTQVHVLEARLCNATDLKATERVAEALLLFQDRWTDRNWKRKELADWAGTTEETVIRTLSQLKDEGIMRQEGRKIIVTDRHRLLEKAKISV